MAQTRTTIWMAWMFLILVGGVVAAYLIVELIESNDAALGSFVALAVTLALVGGVVGRIRGGHPLGLLVDSRNKLSVSQLQIALWTIVIASSLGAAALVNVADFPGGEAPLNITVHEDLLLLMGISTAGFAGSALIKAGQLRLNALEVRENGDGPALADLVSAEGVGETARADIGKIQLLFFTAVLVFVYSADVIGKFVDVDARIGELPEVSDGMAVLLAISHGGYLGFKQVKPATPAGGAGGGAGGGNGAGGGAPVTPSEVEPDIVTGRTAE